MPSAPAGFHGALGRGQEARRAYDKVIELGAVALASPRLGPSEEEIEDMLRKAEAFVFRR